MTFRVSATRALPGSLLPDGSVVDYLGNRRVRGPCFIPADIKPARKGALGKAGWYKTPVKHWPSLLPMKGLACIHRPKMLTRCYMPDCGIDGRLCLDCAEMIGR